MFYVIFLWKFESLFVPFVGFVVGHPKFLLFCFISWLFDVGMAVCRLLFWCSAMDHEHVIFVCILLLNQIMIEMLMILVDCNISSTIPFQPMTHMKNQVDIKQMLIAVCIMVHRFFSLKYIYCFFFLTY